MSDDPLSCSFSDAERNHLLDGIRMSTRAKIDFFEEMVSLAVAAGARDRLSQPSAGTGGTSDQLPRNRIPEADND